MENQPLLDAVLPLLLLIWPVAAFAQEGTNPDTYTPPSIRPFELVLPSEHLLGTWGGVRTQLEDAGIKPNLTLVTDFAWNPSGGQSQGATAPSSLAFDVSVDLEKTSGLKGASLLATTSTRWGDSLSAEDIGNVFQVQQIYGFQTYRLIDVAYLQQLLDDRVEVRIGRFATADDFLVSAYNYGFVQGGFNGTPAGIFFNAPGMTAYTGTWAAMVRVRPTARSYVMTGMYNGDPTIRENNRHGVDLSLNA